MRFNILAGITLMSFTVHSFAALETESEKLSYSLGARLAEQLQQFEGVDPDTLAKGIKDAMTGNPLELDKDAIRQYIAWEQKNIQKKHQQQLKEQAEKNLRKGEQFLEMNSQQPDVITLDSGIQYKVLKMGTGAKPKKTNGVFVHYEGRLLDGTVFDSSYQRNQPAQFKLNQVIRGWTESLPLMSEGSIWEIYVPANFAYGSGGIPGVIEPNELLTFKVELIEVMPEA